MPLHLECIDYDFARKDDPLGDASVDLKGLEVAGHREVVAPLSFQGDVQGELHLELRWEGGQRASHIDPDEAAPATALASTSPSFGLVPMPEAPPPPSLISPPSALDRAGGTPTAPPRRSVPRANFATIAEEEVATTEFAGDESTGSAGRAGGESGRDKAKATSRIQI